MKAVILAGGYGTRLERDLREDTTGLYKHLIGVPKPLLPVGTQPLISHWAQQIQKTQQIDAVYVVTNGINNTDFRDWAKPWPFVKLVNDGSLSDETRDGAIAGINTAVTHCNIADHVVLIAGDTLFYEDFELENYVTKFETLCKQDPEANMLVYVSCPDQAVSKYGILETDPNNLVTGFLEKPQPDETKSRKACPCFYFLNKSSLSLLQYFLDLNKDKPLKARDATGNFVAFLYKRRPVYAVPVSARFDVGGLQTYIECHQYHLAKHNLGHTIPA